MSKLVSLILSIYIAAVIYANAFFIKILTVTQSSTELFWNHLGIFLIILVPVFFLVKRLVAVPQSRGVVGYLRMALLGVVLVGLIITVLYHGLTIESVYNMPSFMDMVFGSEAALTLWLIVPLLVLFI